MSYLRRYGGIRPSRGTVWPLKVRRAIEERDQGCVGPRVGFPGDCLGGNELDHVRAGGTGMKSRSKVDNGVQLCGGHHRYKTEHGRIARPPLLDWIANHPTPEPEETS